MKHPLLPAVLTVLCMALLYLPLSMNGVLTDFGGDSAVYWLTAKAWSPFVSASAVARDTALASRYPPLYPAVLALLGGGESLQQAHVVTLGSLGIGFSALWAYGRSAGLSPWGAALVMLFTASAQAVRLEGLDLHSEPLYFALTTGFLALTRLASDRTGPRWACAALLALALLTRSSAVGLLLAALWLALRGRWREQTPVLLAGTLTLLGNHFLQHSESHYWQQFLERQQAGTPLEPLLINLDLLPWRWAAALGGETLAAWQVAALALSGLAALGAACCRAWRGELDGHYVLLACALIVLWPFPAELQRLLMPLIGVLAVQLIAELGRLRQPWAGVSQTTLGALPLVATLGSGLAFASQALIGLPPELARFRYTAAWLQTGPESALEALSRYAAAYTALEQLRLEVPAESCVVSVKPSVVAALSGLRGVPPPAEVLPDEQWTQWFEHSPCDYYLLLWFPTPTYRSPFYPAARLGERLSILKGYAPPHAPRDTVALLARRQPHATQPVKP